MRKTLKTLTGAIVTFLAVGVGTPSAEADDGDRHRPEQPKVEVAEYNFDPLTDNDALVTDTMEEQAPLAAGACSYEPVVSTPNGAPASPSFQILYVVPSDQRATDSLDRPLTCNNGDYVYSALARASRNLATWQDRRGAGLHYRTLNGSYTHDYSGQTIVTRSVRRVRSSYTRAQWDSLSVESTDGSSPRLRTLMDELDARGFNVSNTRYAIVLHAAAQPKPAGCTGNCGHYVGAAQSPGKYGMTMRVYPASSSATGYDEVPIRFGCNTYNGDAFFGHETTHQVGASHFDSGYDLMRTAKSKNVSFGTSPYLTWDANRTAYHSTVYNSVYVVRQSLSGSYYSC